MGAGGFLQKMCEIAKLDKVLRKGLPEYALICGRRWNHQVQ